ncbi:MAG: ATP-dependent chaperone ClpB [Flavobacteriales bacterium]|nr:ATP-dependent chaperone ClpB [Flavobacteriales bacterium]
MNLNTFTIKSQEAIQKAQELAFNAENPVIETGHLLKALLIVDEHVINYAIKKVNANVQRIESALDSVINTYPVQKGGNTNPHLSNDANSALLKSQSLLKEFGDEFVSIELIFLGLLKGKDTIANLLKDAGIKEAEIKKAFTELRGKGSVKSQTVEDQYNALGKYAKNLNALAREGKLDPVIGRDDEIRRVLQILSRRTKNNPILIGEPGVGKTAIAEGLAHRIVQGDIPENLKSKTLFSLDMGSLIAGAKYKGEFEDRLKGVVKEVIGANGEIILFIDEIHTLVGAGGGGESAMDAANILKPALARGELRAIGATTLAEYQKYIEKDKALERRFQTVMIEEPDSEDAISILRGLKERYEVHHKVRIKDEAIIAAVELSQRYISDRFLPDKAIDLVDEAAAKLRLEIDSVPEELDELDRRIMQLEIEKEAIKREGSEDKVEEINKKLSELSEERNDLKAEWQSEKQIVEAIQGNKTEIENLKYEAEQAERSGDYGKVAEIRYGKMKEIEKNLEKLNTELMEKQEKGALVKEEVDSEDIADVVSKWTGIPVKSMLQSEREKLLNLENELHHRVIGQDEAIEAISNAIRRNRAGLSDPKKPIGSFIFLGTTGVGKTELAKALAEYLFDQEKAMIRIDMSEYQEKHTVSRLVGAPPGYVGYDEGGQLTEAVRRRPYSVILLDEIEKAHPDVFNILLQVLDDGRLTDNKGRTANFKNTLLIMTSNLGSHLIQEKFENYLESQKDEIMASTKAEVFELLKRSIRPEFINRIDEIVMFTPLSRDEVRQIVALQFSIITNSMKEMGYDLQATEEVLDWIGELGYDPQFGARPLKRVMQRELLNELSKEIIAGKIRKDKPVLLRLENQKLVFGQGEPEPVILN